MSKNHETHARKSPTPYQGSVTKAGTPQANREEWSIIEAANFHDLPPIICRFGYWAVCEDGLHSLYINYYISKERFDEPDWIDHMRSKTWVDIHDFTRAFDKAKKLLNKK